jgi:hypothetical protein
MQKNIYYIPLYLRSSGTALRKKSGISALYYLHHFRTASWRHPTQKKTFKYMVLTTYVIYLSMALQSFLLDLGRFFSFLICTQSAGLLGRGISASQGRYLHTEQHKHTINTHRHPCLEWDSNPQSQRSSEQRQFMT